MPKRRIAQQNQVTSHTSRPPLWDQVAYVFWYGTVSVIVSHFLNDNLLIAEVALEVLLDRMSGIQGVTLEKSTDRQEVRGGESYSERIRHEFSKLEFDFTSFENTQKTFRNADGLISLLKKGLNQDLAPGKRVSKMTIEDDAEVFRAKQYLQKIYNTDVVVVDTDQDFSSELTLRRMVREDILVISKENPLKTAEMAEYLARYSQVRSQELLENPDAVTSPIDLRDRAKQLLEQGNKKRIDEASKGSAKIGEQISAIVQEYRQTHSGKEVPFNTIAEILNERKISPPRGDKWYASGIKRVIEKHNITR
ncbi:hypothetical protein GCM10028808_57880 [Spirosoma migulaei]